MIGEVQNSTSHLYREGLTRDDYIRLSGGVTTRADEERTFIVRADGSVTASSERLVRPRRADAVHPGDTSSFRSTRRREAAELWTSVTQILYNIAVAVAAVNSF